MEENKKKMEEWDWAKHKPNNILNVPCSSEKDFFTWWCIFFDPFVPLTDREREVVASYLKHRTELSKVILDPDIVDYQLMSNEVKNKVIKDCNMTLAHYYVVMSSLRKKKVFLESGINPKLIPNVRKDDNGCFQLLILIKENQEK